MVLCIENRNNKKLQIIIDKIKKVYYILITVIVIVIILISVLI